jgi:hypothetical protein
LPKELLLGIAINTPRTELERATTETPAADTLTHITYVAQQHLDGYEAIIKHAITWKHTFNRHIQAKLGEVVFSKGQLVQIYRSDLDYTFKTERKLAPKWSTPHCITDRATNSYTLAWLDGTPIEGEFSTRCLRVFVPQPGSHLEKDQQEWEIEHREWLGGQQESVGVTVWTPLLARGEHGVGIEGQAGQRQQEASCDEIGAHSTDPAR